MELPPALSSQRSRLRLRGDRVHVAQSDVTLAEADVGLWLRATLFSAQRAVLVPARLIVSETRVSEGTRASGTRASGTRASDSWTLVAAQEISLTQCNVLRISDTASGRIPMELPPALSSQRSRLRLRGDRVHVAQSDVTLAEAD
ncbi:MAG: hypothetical protein MHM6MM_009500, partial [Cercozoa sp. M6MM]